MAEDTVFDKLTRYRKTHGAMYGILKMGVFGSTARREHGLTSDVDIVVELTKPDLLILVGIKQDLEEILERPVDVVRYRDNMNQFLKRRIDGEAIYV